MQTALILLAAGRATRMRGADKLLEDVGGAPCIRALALRGLAARMPVVVALPAARDHPRAQVLAEMPVLRLPVADADRGMAHSLRAAVAALPEGTEAAVVLPGDMPEVRCEDLLALREAAAARPDRLIIQATTEDGRPGHPVLFRKALFAEFAGLSGDSGARALLERHADKRLLVARPGNRARLDLDTPEAWAAWRGTG